MINKDLLRYIEQFDKAEQANVLAFLTSIRESIDLHYELDDSVHFRLIKDKIISRNYLTNSYQLLVCFYDGDEVGLAEIHVPQTSRNVVQTRLHEYRDMFRGIRIGAMGDSRETAFKMERFLMSHPVSFDRILEATAYYIQNSVFIMNADNFIYALNKEGREYSKLESVLEEFDGSVNRNLVN